MGKCVKSTLFLEEKTTLLLLLLQMCSCALLTGYYKWKVYKERTVNNSVYTFFLDGKLYVTNSLSTKNGNVLNTRHYRIKNIFCNNLWMYRTTQRKVHKSNKFYFNRQYKFLGCLPYCAGHANWKKKKKKTFLVMNCTERYLMIRINTVIGNKWERRFHIRRQKVHCSNNV